MLCNAMVHVWYNDSYAMIWDLNAIPCYGVCFKRYACKLKKSSKYI